MSDSALTKSATGIAGLDQITGGGLPSGRPTLVCGSAGSGKTMLALEFLVRGATQFGEPGVCMMFEESAAELTANVRSLGFDLDELVAQKKLVLDYVHIERSEIEETGEYDLEGLFIRLGHADRFDRRKARRTRYGRSAVRRLAESRHSPLRTAASVPLAEGSRTDGNHHRRERRRKRHHPLRPRGVRGGLRDHAGSTRAGPGSNATPARSQVPGYGARHQRVSVPHQ